MTDTHTQGEGAMTTLTTIEANGRPICVTSLRGDYHDQYVRPDLPRCGIPADAKLTSRKPTEDEIARFEKADTDSWAFVVWLG
jgi:hypothetical protein